jgi:hypothetical protein
MVLRGRLFALLFAAVFASTLAFVSVAGAQDDGTGVPAGTPAEGTNPVNATSPPNLVTIAESCVVDEGASITLEDGDGTQASFVDGQQEIEITGNGEVRIDGPDDDYIGDHATFPDPNDQSFDTAGDYQVATTTGIRCDGGGAGGAAREDGDDGDDALRGAEGFRCEEILRIFRSAADDQYDFSAARIEQCLAREVMDDRRGKLAKTGGTPLLPVAAFLLLGAGILVGRSVSSWRER